MNNDTPSGVVQFFEPLSSLRRKTENDLMDFYTHKGYKEVVTSLFSYENNIFDSLFEPLKTKLFKVVDKNNGQTMVLRADITMQITQAIITGDFDMPVRVCYADNIYRDVEEHSGKKREFRQTGIELFGISAIKADREVIDIAVSSLKSIGVENIYLRLSDTSILERLLKDYTINNKYDVNKIKELLYKKNLDLVIKMFKDLPQDFIAMLKVLNKQSGYFESKDSYKSTKKYTENVVNLAEEIHKLHKDVTLFLDLFYCEHPIYHYGVVFDVFSGNVNLAVGGRYGNVTRQFGRYIPATGFAINLDELTYFLFEREKK